MQAARHAALMMKMNDRISCTAVTVLPFTREMAEFAGMKASAYEREINSRVTPVLEKVREIFAARGLQLSTAVLQGDIPRAIVDYAGRGGYQQIIMGSRGLSEIKGALLGSVSHRVVQLARCPVTLVK